MKGRLTFDHTPCVWVEVPGYSTGQEFVVDTGFNGSLYLPDFIIRSWNLSFISSIPVILANQTRVIADAYECTVVWFGVSLRVSVLEGPSDCDPLVGMELLEGCRIELDGADGEVRIEEL